MAKNNRIYLRTALPKPNSGEPYIIKKSNPGRRLYATHIANYIKECDVLLLIEQGYSVKIIERKTGRDLTLSILFNILKEKESHAPTLTVADLFSLILKGTLSHEDHH